MHRFFPSVLRAAVPTALALLAAAAGPTVAGTISVSGTVRDAATLDPVAGVFLTLHVLDPDSVAFSTTSGGDGAYAITGAPDGNRLYVLTGGGGSIYANFYARLPTPDPDLAFDVLLDSLQIPSPGDPPDSSAVFGHVLSASGSQPVPGASVTLSAEGSSYLAYTGGDGSYAVTLPPGTYSVDVDADGYEPVVDSGLEVSVGGLTYTAFLQLSTTDTPPPDLARVAGIRSIRPNPLRTSTQIHYVLASPGHVELTIYDLSGREVSHVVSAWNDAGPHVVTISAAHLPAGVYFCGLRAPGLSASRRIAILP